MVKALYRLKLSVKKMTFNNRLNPAYHKTQGGIHFVYPVLFNLFIRDSILHLFHIYLTCHDYLKYRMLEY